MVDYLSALSSPHRFQFETNSGTLNASQTNNCGPTCVTKIAQFYRNTWFGIEATRKLVMGCCVSTMPSQQRDMLIKRGVPASVVQIDSVSQMRNLVAGGKRPIVIGVYMARVPVSVRDHSFLGWHAICVMDIALVNGVSGFWVNDPNFSPVGGIRPDPDKGRKFYSNSIMQYAFIQNAPRWSIVPNQPKVVSTPTPTPTTGLADGDPYPMRFRNLISTVGSVGSYRMKAGTPIRKGPLVSSALWMTVPAELRIFPHAYISKADLPIAEQGYGDVFMVNHYQTNGHHIGYVKAVDLV